VRALERFAAFGAAGLLVVLGGLCVTDRAVAAPRGPVNCLGKRATIVGTPRADLIRGTARADVIAGLGGDDRIYGLAGNDRICGGPGADFIQGGDGIDSAIGGAGRNICAEVERRTTCAEDLREPRLVGASVAADRLVATFNETLDPALAATAAGFEVSVNGLATSVSSARLQGRTLALTLDRPVFSDDRVTFGWESETFGDFSGNIAGFREPSPVPNASISTGCNPYAGLGADANAVTIDPSVGGVYPGLPRRDEYLPTSGDLHAVMLFVDFPDAPGTGSLDDLDHAFVDGPQNWFPAVSYGRLRLTVTPLLQWLHMPQPSTSYNVDRLGDFLAYTAYLNQAIQLADPLVDFQGTDIVYVVATAGSRIGLGPAWIATPQAPLATVDGVAIHEAAGEPASVLLPAGPGFVFTHESGHMLGLPDLYDFGASGAQSPFGFVGSWDLMSDEELGEGLMGWQRWRLGWLDPQQIRCAQPGKQLSVTLTPLEQPGGVKMIVVPTSATTATVIENRQSIGEDSRLCYAGALVYQVSATTPSGRGPIRVLPAHTDEGVNEFRCGPLARAPLEAGESLRDPVSGATITVASGDGGALAVTVSPAP
jgi:M6 family metalloprotease-like protein